MAKEGNLGSRFRDMMGIPDDDEYENDGYEEDYIDDEYIDDDNVYENSPIIPQQRSETDVLVLDPETFEEAPTIVNKLKESKTIVVNLKQAEFEEGRKIMDFLAGAVYALEGTLNRIAESVYILAPKSVSVSTQIDKPKNTITPQMADWDNN